MKIQTILLFLFLPLLCAAETISEKHISIAFPSEVQQADTNIGDLPSRIYWYHTEDEHYELTKVLFKDSTGAFYEMPRRSYELEELYSDFSWVDIYETESENIRLNDTTQIPYGEWRGYEISYKHAESEEIIGKTLMLYFKGNMYMIKYLAKEKVNEEKRNAFFNSMIIDPEVQQLAAAPQVMGPKAIMKRYLEVLSKAEPSEILGIIGRLLWSRYGIMILVVIGLLGFNFLRKKAKTKE